MGTFVGHLGDGLCIVMWACWQMVNIMRRMFKAKLSKNATPWETQFFYEGSSVICKLPLDSTVKIIFGIISIAIELSTAMENGVFVRFGNLQHITMIVFFMLSGVADLIQHYQWPVPEHLEGAMLSLAFGVQAFIFHNHQHGTSPFEMLIHKFIVYVALATALCIFYECHAATGPLAALIRILLVMLQGTWLIHIGFMLYPPFSWLQPWNTDSHKSLMLASALFAWHVVAIMILMFVVSCIVFKIVKASNKSLHIGYTTLVQDD